MVRYVLAPIRASCEVIEAELAGIENGVISCDRYSAYKKFARPANWINIGQTAVRGKKSKSHQQLIAVKDIWMYPLRKNFAAVLCR